MASGTSLIYEESIQSARDFEWIACQLANGFVQGKHRSTRLGTGHEFQQYRAYVPGDDVRNIDWKMYAKTEKFFVKQAVLDTEHRFHFLIDSSPSMLYKEAGRSKFFLAKLLSSAMMRIAAIQGDYFSWNAETETVPGGTGMRHWHYATQNLYNLASSSEIAMEDVHTESGKTLVWISDFYEMPQIIRRRIQKLKTLKTELLVFHVIGERERKLEFAKNTTFKDLESGETIDVDSSRVRERYERKLAAHHKKVRRIITEQGAYYQELSMNKSLKEALRSFFYHQQYSQV